MKSVQTERLECRVPNDRYKLVCGSIKVGGTSLAFLALTYLGLAIASCGSLLVETNSHICADLFSGAR